MPTIELTAKTVDEATRVAAESLGVPASEVKVTVLEESKGLFGRSTVKVRAEAASPAPVAAAAPAAEAVEAPAEKPARGRGRAKKTEEPAEAPVAEVAAEPVAEEAPKRGRGRGRKSEEAPVAEVPAASAEAPAPAEESGDIVASDADAKQLLGIMLEIVEASGLEVEVTQGEVQGRYVSLVIKGKDASYLVGKHGEVLNALQYLVNVIAGRRYDNGVRATVDANSYREDREAQILEKARAIAAKVVEMQQEALFDPLPAFERRIIHKAISEMEGVETYSEGEEPNRCVVIAPKEA